MIKALRTFVRNNFSLMDLLDKCTTLLPLLVIIIMLVTMHYPFQLSSASLNRQGTQQDEPTFILNPSVSSYYIAGNIASVLLGSSSDMQSSNNNSSTENVSRCMAAASSSCPHFPNGLIYRLQPGRILSGNWSMQVQNATVARFHAYINVMTTDGKQHHLYEIINFRQHPHTPALLDLNGTFFSGSTEIKRIEDGFSWYGVPTSITIAKHDVIKIVPNPRYLNDSFGSQPIYGIVNQLREL